MKKVEIVFSEILPLEIKNLKLKKKIIMHLQQKSSTK